eukprot:3264469-Prymnesium_polylepis.1
MPCSEGDALEPPLSTTASVCRLHSGTRVVRDGGGSLLAVDASQKRSSCMCAVIALAPVAVQHAAYMPAPVAPTERTDSVRHGNARRL